MASPDLRARRRRNPAPHRAHVPVDGKVLVTTYDDAGTKILHTREVTHGRLAHGGDEDFLLQRARETPHGAILAVDDGHLYKRRVRVVRHGGKIGYEPLKEPMDTMHGRDARRENPTGRFTVESLMGDRVAGPFRTMEEAQDVRDSLESAMKERLRVVEKHRSAPVINEVTLRKRRGNPIKHKTAQEISAEHWAAGRAGEYGPPRPRPVRLTLREAQADLRGHGITLSKKDDEYRVTFSGETDRGAGYFTNDLKDAIDTGHLMAARHKELMTPGLTRSREDQVLRDLRVVRARSQHHDLPHRQRRENPDDSRHTHDVFTALRAGDKVRIHIKPRGTLPPTSRVVEVTSSAKQSTGALHVYVTGGAVRPGHIAGGVLTLRDGELSYQPSMQQSPVRVSHLTIVSANTPALTHEGRARRGNPAHRSRLLPSTEEFIAAYLEAALWSSTDESDEGGGRPLDETYAPSDIDPASLRQLEGDAQAFLDAHHELIGTEYARAGHDFWLTRNGHGAGFWDGDWPEPAATELTKAAEAYGTQDLYVGDDGQLHVSPLTETRQPNPAPERRANPLQRGSTREVISHNIAKLMEEENYPQKQAVAIALNNARRYPTPGHPVPRRPNPVDYVANPTVHVDGNVDYEPNPTVKVDGTVKVNPAKRQSNPSKALPDELRARVKEWQGKTGTPTRMLVSTKRANHEAVHAAIDELRKVKVNAAADKQHLAKTIRDLEAYDREAYDHPRSGDLHPRSTRGRAANPAAAVIPAGLSQPKVQS